jgi:hypothetical protein
MEVSIVYDFRLVQDKVPKTDRSIFDYG